MVKNVRSDFKQVAMQFLGCSGACYVVTQVKIFHPKSPSFCDSHRHGYMPLECVHGILLRPAGKNGRFVNLHSTLNVCV